ncbi:uncharacterized protein VICG_01337 [Vittaforma corneae ATCC 50505]|uniref:60S ribosomal export protein NMD3 n=1 Tax=Vittaforma corneae (strain ATCC 50505) TaxID=993615 RepID=L2GLU8_VITCO|nr:uncharacterized protein VICG_01337 [Vittaforma corneae ATCC 50505]ELA41589.1 hypothetical protein VICG_01337 [Vittaforma corneae ATCC 50505]
MIHCCKCGIEIEPNMRSICFRCLNNETDVTRSIKTSMAIETCRGCKRYFFPSKGWKVLSWGSQDLLIFLLGRNKSLKGLNIVDSNFVYTEEHSMRMIVEIKVAQDGIEQSCMLRYNVTNMQCTNCMRTEAKQYWKALVQLRQRPHHKRTFLYIEQLILKHKAHLPASNIKERKDGIDFYYLDRQDAVHMVDFLSSYCGTRVINSSRLISEDESNNTANKKFTFSVEILPFCKDDLVYLGPGNMLGLGNFALVSRVGSTVTFFDPVTQKSNKLYSKQYYSNEDKFKILMRSCNFKKYRVVYCRPLGNELYEATLTADDLKFFDVTTHLKIKDDDTVAGYNLEGSNLATDIDLGTDILLVRVFNNSKRNWTLKSEKEVDDEYMYFIDDISNDKEMLNRVCVFDSKDELVDNIETLGI